MTQFNFSESSSGGSEISAGRFVVLAVTSLRLNELLWHFINTTVTFLCTAHVTMTE